MGKFSDAGNAAQGGVQPAKKSGWKPGGWGGGGGGKSADPFDPRATEKDFFMAAMNAATTAGVALQLQQALGQLASDADVPALLEELRERFYQGLVAKAADMKRGVPAGVVNADGSTTDAQARKAADTAAKATDGEVIEVPQAYLGYPHASERWPLGQFGPKNPRGAMTLAETLAYTKPDDRGRPAGPGFMAWFITTTQKQEKFATFKAKLGEFMDAAAEDGFEFPEKEG